MGVSWTLNLYRPRVFSYFKGDFFPPPSVLSRSLLSPPRVIFSLLSVGVHRCNGLPWCIDRSLFLHPWPISGNSHHPLLPPLTHTLVLMVSNPLGTVDTREFSFFVCVSSAVYKFLLVTFSLTFLAVYWGWGSP